MPAQPTYGNLNMHAVSHAQPARTKAWPHTGPSCNFLRADPFDCWVPAVSPRTWRLASASAHKVHPKAQAPFHLAGRSDNQIVLPLGPASTSSEPYVACHVCPTTYHRQRGHQGTRQRSRCACRDSSTEPTICSTPDLRSAFVIFWTRWVALR